MKRKEFTRPLQEKRIKRRYAENVWRNLMERKQLEISPSTTGTPNLKLIHALPYDQQEMILSGLTFPTLLTLARADKKMSDLVLLHLQSLASQKYSDEKDQNRALCRYIMNNGSFCPNVFFLPGLLSKKIVCKNFCQEQVHDPLYWFHLYERWYRYLASQPLQKITLLDTKDEILSKHIFTLRSTLVSLQYNTAVFDLDTGMGIIEQIGREFPDEFTNFGSWITSLRSHVQSSPFIGFAFKGEAKNLKTGTYVMQAHGTSFFSLTELQAIRIEITKIPDRPHEYQLLHVSRFERQSN